MNETSPEIFAQAYQIGLLQTCLAAWQRRGKTLLEINCGEGRFLPLLWEYGFDVTGTELNPELRAAALAAIGTRAEIEAASDDHLPFENDSFDWVILHASLTDAFESAAREALRVAAGGLAVTFWNTTSLAYAAYRLGGRRTYWPTPAYRWWKIWSTLKNFRAGPLTTFTTLVGSSGIWGSRYQTTLCHACLRILPLGAWGIVRLDITPPGFVTPLPIYSGRAGVRPPEPAVDFNTLWTNKASTGQSILNAGPLSCFVS
ncbi:MAG: class I SAM-dependent methyltransferase [Desulfovibrio sp.]|jgi:SAM-dependent methyltransferase|nr:class I SAM-dependent methyltransferase [Desulfovibrio sp.]